MSFFILSFEGKKYRHWMTKDEKKNIEKKNKKIFFMHRVRYFFVRTIMHQQREKC